MVLVHPAVESGISDDWSIVRTAQLLAQTGHIHYNGWEAPMLGWPLYLAAAAFRLFGFSITAARLVTMIIALVTVYLVHRIFVRFGISDQNAAWGAVTLGLCPVFFQCSVLFMTDVPGLFAVLLCLYCCVRAVQSESGPWLLAAALSNAVLGTARQNAWLGLLVIVPAATILLRHNRRAFWMGILSCGAGLTLMALALLWLSRQPYVLPEHLTYNVPPASPAHVAITLTFCAFADVVLLLLPVTLAFVPRLRPNRKLLLAGMAIACGLALVFARHHANRLSPFLIFPLPQTAENTFLSNNMPVLGPSPSTFPQALRLLFTLLSCAAGVGVLAALKRPRGRLTLLLISFVIACFASLIPRALYVYTLDRYLLYFLPFALVYFLQLYQDAGHQSPSALGLATLVLFGAYTVTTTHDLCAVYRANLTAANELLASGIPRNQVSAGAEFDSYTQLLSSDYVHTPGIRMPDASIFKGEPWIPPNHCAQLGLEMYPVLRPRYALAYPDSPCVPAPFAPVHFSTWLPPFHRTIDVVEYGVERP